MYFFDYICALNGFTDYGFIRRHDASVVGSGRSLVWSIITLNAVYPQVGIEITSLENSVEFELRVDHEYLGVLPSNILDAPSSERLGQVPREALTIGTHLSRL